MKTLEDSAGDQGSMSTVKCLKASRPVVIKSLKSVNSVDAKSDIMYC